MEVSDFPSNALANANSLSYMLIKSNVFVVTEFDHGGKTLFQKLVRVPLVFATNNEVIGIGVFL